MQQSRTALDNDTADHDVEAADNEIKVIWYLRFPYSHCRSALADFNGEAANDLCFTQPFSGEEQITEECHAAIVPFAAEVLGLDTAEIGRSLCRFHRVTSVLAEIPSAIGRRGSRQLDAPIRMDHR